MMGPPLGPVHAPNCAWEGTVFGKARRLGKKTVIAVYIFVLSPLLPLTRVQSRAFKATSAAHQSLAPALVFSPQSAA